MRRAIAASIIALTSSLGAARAQAPSPRYPTAAPMEQYRSKSKTEEIALARSAAPPSISANAEVLVLGEYGYETAVKGTNGFVCFVERGWALSGASKEEIMKRTRSAYADHTFKTPEPGAMTYMLSKETRNSAGDSWLPHLMFFVPAGQTTAWGACEKSYPIICWRGDEIQSTVFLIPVRAWSDGSPAPPVAVQHAQLKK